MAVAARRRWMIVRWISSICLVIAASALVLLSRVDKGPMTCQYKFDATPRLVEKTCSPIGVTDVVPLLFLAALLLLPDFRELSTPFGLSWKWVEDELEDQRKATSAAFELASTLALGPMRHRGGELFVDRIFGRLGATMKSRGAPDVQPAEVAGSDLFTRDIDHQSRDEKKQLLAAIWNRVGPLTQLAEHLEQPGVWASDATVASMRSRLAKLENSRVLSANLVRWVKDYRHLRNRGWGAFNTMNDLSDQQLSEAIIAARVLLARAEEALSASGH